MASRPFLALVTNLQRAAAPDDPEKQVEVPPVVGVDDVADQHVAEKHDIGGDEIGMPRPLPEQAA